MAPHIHNQVEQGKHQARAAKDEGLVKVSRPVVNAYVEEMWL